MLSSIGDLATGFSNRLANHRIRTELTTLSQELASGRRSDLRTALAGDIAPVASLERSLSGIAAYRTVIAESGLLLGAAQSALGQVSDHVGSLGKSALDMENTVNQSLVANFGRDAASRFGALVGTLNTTISGRALFSGDATATRPVDAPDLILDDLVASLPPGAGAQDVSDAVDAYFAVGGGFESTRYLGSVNALGELRVSPADRLDFDVSARSEQLRHALGATAKAALIDRSVLSGDQSEQRSLIRIAGQDLLGAEAAVVALRGDVGILEGRLDAAAVRNSTERDSLELALSSLISADPFATATRLQLVQTQLETFYMTTARLSQLSLAGYLR